ncbi:MAG: hypothetical protein AAGA56_06625 [Myxococcota bacterium]
MTVVLAIAAVGLVAGLVYFAVTGRGVSGDPASVDVGAEQREYDDEPTPASSTEPAPPAAPRPPPRPRPPPGPAPTPKKKSAGDIYDDL